MPRGRATYHHGDLRNALVEAASGIARDGGPGAVSVRAAARAAGVTPTAAYRHFTGRDALLDAARQEAFDRLNAAMTARLDARARADGAAEDALGALAALGRGYLDFATDDPGLFRTVFSAATGFPPVEDQPRDSPFRALVTVVDDLVAAGYLPADLRPGTDVVVWAQIHGLATLLLDGPLAGVGAEVREALFGRMMQLLVRGLVGDAALGFHEP